MQNEACYFDKAIHIDLLVYINPILPKQCPGQRDLLLLIAIVNFLYPATCFPVFRNVNELCLWQSLYNPTWNMKDTVPPYHSKSLPKSPTRREVKH